MQRDIRYFDTMYLIENLAFPRPTKEPAKAKAKAGFPFYPFGINCIVRVGLIAEIRQAKRPTRFPESTAVSCNANSDGVLLCSFQVSNGLFGGFLRRVSHAHLAVLDRSIQAFDASIQVLISSFRMRPRCFRMFGDSFAVSGLGRGFSVFECFCNVAFRRICAEGSQGQRDASQ